MTNSICWGSFGQIPDHELWFCPAPGHALVSGGWVRSKSEDIQEAQLVDILGRSKLSRKHNSGDILSYPLGHKNSTVSSHALRGQHLQVRVLNTRCNTTWYDMIRHDTTRRDTTWPRILYYTILYYTIIYYTILSLLGLPMRPTTGSPSTSSARPMM